VDEAGVAFVSRYNRALTFRACKLQVELHPYLTQERLLRFCQVIYIYIYIYDTCTHTHTHTHDIYIYVCIYRYTHTQRERQRRRGYQ
jgi:diketogulonate reductase-like aldo/keto reductase